MRSETEATLRRVVAKAKKLETSTFVAQLIEPGWHLGCAKQEPEITRPTEEARDAFILTFRFFVVKNERTSFAGLAAFLDAPDVSPQWKEAFSNLRSAVNACLETSLGEYQYGGKKQSFSNWVILETFLYGGLVHANNRTAIARYEEWVAHPWIFALLEMWFISTIQKLLMAVRYLAALCEEELERAGSAVQALAG